MEELAAARLAVAAPPTGRTVLLAHTPAERATLSMLLRLAPRLRERQPLHLQPLAVEELALLQRSRLRYQ